MSRVFRPAPVWLAAALVVCHASAWAQRSGLSITPTFSAQQEFTDNLYLSATNQQSESITTLSPGVRMSSRSGRVQGSLDYSLSGIIYGRNTAASTFTNDLAADLSAEFIENHGFIDIRASIGQEPISAFGLQGDRPDTINSNITEYRTLTLSPSLRGRPAGQLDVEARLTSTFESSAEASIGGSTEHIATLSLGNSSRALGWSVLASRTYRDFEDGRATTEDRITPQISYTVNAGLRIFVTGGYERNDILTLEPTEYKNWGGGFEWQPSPRTRFNVQTEQRYFGRSWNVGFSHRMRRTVVAYSDVNDDNESTTGSGAPLSTYDLFFTQFASLEPEPALRDVLVRNFLQASGLDPNQQQTAGFITSAVTVQRSQNLSLALQGRRNNLVLSAFATATRRVDTISDAQDDLSQVDRVRERGASLSLSHRLTPTQAVVLFASMRRTPSSDSAQGNDLREFTFSWTDRIGPRSSLALTGGYTRATGGFPYEENSILATFNYSF